MAEFPLAEWDGNPQDPSNDGVLDPKKFQAADYNETAAEVISIQSKLRNGYVLAVRNESGSALTEGTYVRISALSSGGIPLVVKAIATAETTLADGVVITTIADASNGNIAARHVQGSIDTTIFGAAGTLVFLSDSVAGTATSTKPTIVQGLGKVVKEDASTGVLHNNIDTSGGSAALPGHAFAGASHTPSTLADVNTKISDGTIDKTTDARTPTVHEPSHRQGGTDELDVELLGAPGGSASEVLTADGAGGVAFSPAGAPGTHATTHEDGGADELAAANLAEATAPGNDVSQALRPDGAGGVAFSDVAHADLTGVGIDDHHARDHAATHTNGTDDIQDATAAQKGVATAAQITKLDGIAAGADVSPVSSVFSRTGAVLAALSDYDASQVDNDSGVTGATVKDALDQLDSDITGIGVAEDVFEWVLNGNVNSGTRFDGGRAVRRAGTILGVIVTAGARGNSGTSLFDVNKFVPTKPVTTQRNATAGTTIYTTQANRPDLAGNSPTSSDNAIKEAVLPDVTTFVAGDFFSIDVDSATNQLQDVTIQLFVKYS